MAVVEGMRIMPVAAVGEMLVTAVMAALNILIHQDCQHLEQVE